MPPTSAMRKTSVATNDGTSRRQSGRQPRTTTNRPINYYARNFGSMSGAVEEPPDDSPPGFFPAIQFFADSISALPREVQRHVTLMKEVEAKVYGPTEALKQLSQKILTLPDPPRRNQRPLHGLGLLSFTANNSVPSSVTGSVINGSAPNLGQRVSDILDPSTAQFDEQADFARRADFQNLRHLIGNVIANLDEKNVVMADTNRALAQQLSRMDSVMPYVEGEISEEARLGSLTHWAYADNRTKKQTGPANNERVRRDVAATSSLAAAAAHVHEGEIAAARGEARREAKKSRAHVDSDFDDRPVKRVQTAKARKGVDPSVDPKVAGLGITNGAANAVAPTKRRKVDKALAAPLMERSASGAKNGKVGNTTPRSTPAVEPVVKQRKKPGPAPGSQPSRKRNAALNSGANSPKLASSPVLANLQMQQEPSINRPASSRMRQNSSTSNLQYSLLPDKDNGRPASAAGNRSVNGNAGATDVGEATVDKDSGNDVPKQKEQDEIENERMNIDEQDVKQNRINALKHEDMAMEEIRQEAPAPRGRQAKTGTPRTDAVPTDTGMLRTRSNRGTNSRTDQSTASEPPSTKTARKNGHRKSGSGAHILKQIANFNRSPVMDRHHDADDVSDLEGEEDDDDETGEEEQDRPSRRSQQPRIAAVSRSRRGNANGNDSRSVVSGSRGRSVPEEEPALEPDAGEEEDGEDPNEDKYCYCGQGSFGEMIACDNDDCLKEWFHLDCTGLRAVPGDNVKWYCDDCKEAMQATTKRKGRPASRHAG